MWFRSRSRSVGNPQWTVESGKNPTVCVCVCVKEVRLPTGRQVRGCVCVYVCVVVCECANSVVCVYYCESLLCIDSLSLVPSKTARNLGDIIDDQLTFTAHIASVSRSCRFALYNIRKIRPYLTQYATQLLVQTLVSSRLDYCNALLTGLPACVVKPLQMIQNAASRLVFNQPKRAHVT